MVKELPPARYPTAQDKVDLFRRHGIEAFLMPPYKIDPAERDLVIRIEGGWNAMKRAISVAEEHELTIQVWTSRQTYREYLLGIEPMWRICFSFWEGTNRPKYGGTWSDLLSM